MANQQPIKLFRPSVRPDGSGPALSPPEGRLPSTPLVTSDAQTEHLKRELFTNLWCVQGKDEQFATPHDYYMALAYSVRNELLKQRIHTAKTYSKQKAKVVYYLSAEFLMGRHLGNGLINLGLYETMRHALADCNLDLDELLEREAETGSGQWWLGPAGGLLYGFVDYPEHSSGGLRHSLRVWHLHPGHSGWLPGRDSR